MPPSRHSSSHHSSSHHSSSHHSSSRSTSHHSSSHHSSSGSSSGFGFGGGSHRSGFGSGSGPRHYHHSNSSGNLGGLWWMLGNSRSGRTTNSTYTETYQTDRVPVQTKEIVCNCPYCDSTFHYTDMNGISDECPNCGGKMDIEEKVTTSYTNPHPQNTTYTESRQSTKSGNKGLKILFMIPVLFVIFSALSMIIGVFSFLHSDFDDDFDVNYSYEETMNPSSIYVEELGRTCYWSDAYNSYYDEKTDCYFWFNDEEPAAWQYWYEGISSNYGDYGWMEYDNAKKRWYIEKSYDNWIELPEKYISDRLWHIEE